MRNGRAQRNDRKSKVDLNKCISFQTEIVTSYLYAFWSEIVKHHPLASSVLTN